MGEILILNKDNFEQTIKNNELVLVDFFANWCGPCKLLAPILEQLAAGNETTAVIAKVDIDQSLEIAKSFGIMSVPTMIVFKKGEENGRLVGLRQKGQIFEELRK